MTPTYEDTFETCTDCGSGTYVLYPDQVKRCRHCGELKIMTAPKATVGKKTNG